MSAGGGTPESSKKLRSSTLCSNDDDEDELLVALRDFFGVELGVSNNFKSVQQREAVELARRRDSDKVVILPTGGGKSLIFLLPCYLEKDAVTIVVVPLVALQHDILRRCEPAGVDAALWTGRNQVGIRIVMVSAEHLESNAYED
jgi:superfamily II DNA helicase RecQ